MFYLKGLLFFKLIVVNGLIVSTIIKSWKKDMQAYQRAHNFQLSVTFMSLFFKVYVNIYKDAFC